MSDIKLNAALADIIEIMEKHGLRDPAVAIAFTTPIDRKQVHWMTNVSRPDGIKLLKETANKMIAKAN